MNRAQFQVFFSLGLMRKQTIWILIVRAGYIVYITCVKWKEQGPYFKITILDDNRTLTKYGSV